MPKDLLDEIIEVTDKNSIMLKKLLEHGLNREELIKALFDQTGMSRVKAEVYKSHYEPERNKLNTAIRNLSAVINNPALEWLNGYQKDQLKALKESFTAKRDGLYPNPKGGLTWNQMVGRKAGCLFKKIKPVVDLINKEAGRKRYSKNDIYKLIACLWSSTYGVFEGCFTDKQIKKLYDNFKKSLKK